MPLCKERLKCSKFKIENEGCHDPKGYFCFVHIESNKEPVADVPCNDGAIKPCPLQRGASVEVTNPTMKEGEFMKAIVFNIKWIENTAHGVEPYWRIEAAGFDRDGKRFDASGGADRFKRAL